MAKRFTDTEIWDKEWFMSLPPKIKCLVKYVRDKCDVAGVWQPNWTLVKTYIGEKLTEADLLGIDNGNQFHKLPAGQIYCIGFVNFQYGELTEKCPPHRKILSLLRKHGIENERVLLGYQNPTIRVQEKEEEEEKEKEEEKGGVGENKVPAKDEFLNYCKEVLKEKYASLEFSLSAKYDDWVARKWHDGNNEPIIVWKTKIRNVMPHLKPMEIPTGSKFIH